jgi:adenosyl cobinamide kinase/adenosyl cobinamide phosphate guanylyltransferase
MAKSPKRWRVGRAVARLLCVVLTVLGLTPFAVGQASDYTIVVTNEVGDGVVPVEPAGRLFRRFRPETSSAESSRCGGADPAAS